MASFTDQTPQFNPYIQQLPVEAMMKVGMEKQRRYDEGVQKIQTSIDNVAGLDIVKDSDKQYLQSQLSQLGSKLKTVAAGDFSNYQLVNSVGGMATQIGKDKNIQNAVSATAKLRKEQQRKEKAIQEGKSSPDNEWYFNNQVSKYLDNAEVGESFNAQYVDYTSLDKKLRDLHSKLKEVDKSVDNPFIRDNSGKTIYFNPDGSQSLDTSKGGAPKYDYTMLTTKIKGIGAEKILNNFQDSLDENDKRQLNITAQYHYRNSTIDTIKSDIVKTYDNKKKIYSEAIIDATVKLASSKLNAEQKKVLENEINKAKDLVYKGGFDKEMENELLTVDTEEEVTSYKYKTYAQKYLTNLAKDLDNETVSTEYKNNPGWQALMTQKQFEFDIQKERQREREWIAKHVLEVRADAREERKAQKEEEADQKLRPLVKTEKIQTDITKYGINELDNDIELADKSIAETKNKLAMLLSPNAKTDKEKADALTSANKLYNQYRENPHALDNNPQRQLLEQLDNLDNKQYTLLSKRDAAKKASLPIYELTAKVLNKENGIRVGSTQYSAKELYDFKEDSEKFMTVPKYNVRGDVMGYVMSDNILKQYKGTKKYPIALALYNSLNNKGLSSGEQTIVGQIDKIYKNTNNQVKGLVKQQRDAESKVIYDLSPEYQKMNIQINKDNKRDMNVIDQIIGLKTRDYNDYGALDSERPDDFNPTTLATMREKGNLGFTYDKKNDGSATLVITGGGEIQKIPLTAEEFRNYATDYSYVNPMTDIVYSIQSSPGKTTNKSNGQQGSTARYTGFSALLPGIKNTKIASKVRFDIEGSSYNTGDVSTDLFQAVIYYHDGKNFQSEVLNPGGYLDATNLQILLSQTGPKTIETLFR
jgi:hypothetical protein